MLNVLGAFVLLPALLVIGCSTETSEKRGSVNSSEKDKSGDVSRKTSDKLGKLSLTMPEQEVDKPYKYLYISLTHFGCGDDGKTKPVPQPLPEPVEWEKPMEQQMSLHENHDDKAIQSESSAEEVPDCASSTGFAFEYEDDKEILIGSLFAGDYALEVALYDSEKSKLEYGSTGVQIVAGKTAFADVFLRDAAEDFGDLVVKIHRAGEGGIEPQPEPQPAPCSSDVHRCLPPESKS